MKGRVDKDEKRRRPDVPGFSPLRDSRDKHGGEIPKEGRQKNRAPHKGKEAEINKEKRRDEMRDAAPSAKVNLFGSPPSVSEHLPDKRGKRGPLAPENRQSRVVQKPPSLPGEPGQ
jgi:hypothetical protein